MSVYQENMEEDTSAPLTYFIMNKPKAVKIILVK